MSDLNRLRDAVLNMDCLSQTGFSQIAAIARLSLLAMETPAAQQHTCTLATALEAIQTIADDIQSCINSTAEGVGCNYIDSPARRRMAAQSGGAQS